MGRGLHPHRGRPLVGAFAKEMVASAEAMVKATADKSIACSFCGQHHDDPDVVSIVTSRTGAAICDHCVTEAFVAVQEYDKRAETAWRADKRTGIKGH